MDEGVERWINIWWGKYGTMFMVDCSGEYIDVYCKILSILLYVWKFYTKMLEEKLNKNQSSLSFITKTSVVRECKSCKWQDDYAITAPSIWSHGSPTHYPRSNKKLTKQISSDNLDLHIEQQYK